MMLNRRLENIPGSDPNSCDLKPFLGDSTVVTFGASKGTNKGRTSTKTPFLMDKIHDQGLG